MKLGFKTYQFRTTWENLLDVWAAADSSGVFESGWLFDHHYAVVTGPDGVATFDPDLPCLETWTTLAALAQGTSRLRLGVIVAGVVNHPVGLLAKMACNIDHISGGRLELGLGAGSMPDELRSYGIQIGSVRDRLDRLEEALSAIVGLFTSDSVDRDGRFVTLTDARCVPPPRQRPHPPICIGTRGEERGLRLVARWAQHWNFQGATHAGPAEFQRKSAVLDARCAEIGRDPTSVLRSVVIPLAARDDPSQLTRPLDQYARAGADRFIVGLVPPYDRARLERVAEVLADSGGPT